MMLNKMKSKVNGIMNQKIENIKLENLEDGMLVRIISINKSKHDL
jgi:hypothetical protein